MQTKKTKMTIMCTYILSQTNLADTSTHTWGYKQKQSPVFEYLHQPKFVWVKIYIHILNKAH